MEKTLFNSVIQTLLKKGLVFAVLLNFYSVAQAGEGGVLIAAQESQVSRVEIVELRRIYLGLPSSSDSQIRSPVINLSNKKLFKEFLKNVLHMTEKGYRRKMIKRIFRQGGKKVEEIESLEQLVSYLKANPQDVSFVSAELAKELDGIKVVQSLW